MARPEHHVEDKMLGPCYPVAQAALCAVAKPLRHFARHWAARGVGHGVPHGSIHPAALSHIAAPHAAAPMLACTRVPGVLPAGPLPAAPAGPAGSGSFVGSGSRLTGASYAAGTGGSVAAGSGAAFASFSASTTGVGGGVLGSGGLAGAAAPLAAAALIVAGLITGVMAKPDQSAFSKQPAFQPAVMATMAPPVVLSPTSTALSPVTAFPGAPVMLTAMSQPDMAMSELPEQMPEMPALGTGASTGAGSTTPPEPASLDLLGLCVLAIVAAREWGQASQRWSMRALAQQIRRVRQPAEPVERLMPSRPGARWLGLNGAGGRPAEHRHHLTAARA